MEKCFVSFLQLRPPQPAVYFYVLDVSFNAVSTGYLQTFCQTLLDELDRIPGDARTQIGFITVDSSVHFYNLAEGLSQPQMLVVSDVDGELEFHCIRIWVVLQALSLMEWRWKSPLGVWPLLTVALQEARHL